MHLVILPILALILIYYVIMLTRKNADYWKKRNIVQVDGVMKKFIKGNRSLPELFKEIYDAYDTHVGIFLGSHPALVLKDLEDIQAVAVGDFQSFYKRGIVANACDVLADNVLFIDEFPRWKCIRQKLTPVFTSAKLKNMFYIMDKCARDFVKRLDENMEMKKNPFDALYTYTTAATSASVFGIDTNSKNTMDSPFLAMARKTVNPSLASNIKFFLNIEFPRLFKFLNLKLFGEHEEFFIDAVKKVIESRRHDTVQRHDFIEICLELQKQGTIKNVSTGYELEPTLEVLSAQAFVFFLAGIDTTANSMHFILLQLASEQNILKKVHEEIDSIFADGKEELTFNDVEKLQYLDKVMSESMRMYPSIGSMQRKCSRTTVLPGSKVEIEKDTVIVVPVYGIHRDGKYYPNPDMFDPERFAPENMAKMRRFSYLPFGEGNRICLGARYSRLQQKAALAWLLRKYTLGEQKYAPEHFEQSAFSMRDSKARYDLIRRDV